MKTRTLFISLAVILCVHLTVAAQSTVAEINALAVKTDHFTKINQSPRFFGDTSNEEKSNWRKFKTKKELDNQDEIYEKAIVWSRTGKVIGTNFTLSSPSGDWAHFVMYYFREDGSLAKIHAQLNTFYGEASIIRDQFYDLNGKPIHSTRKVLDLKTQKPKTPKGDFMDQEVVVYKKVSDLPFSQLL